MLRLHRLGDLGVPGEYLLGNQLGDPGFGRDGPPRISGRLASHVDPLPLEVRHLQQGHLGDFVRNTSGGGGESTRVAA